MCFSAEASFTSALLLTVIGVATKSEAKEKRLHALAMIPFLFALQQFGEGVLWLTISNGGEPHAVQEVLKWLFLFFAISFWPIWVPLATMTAEKSLFRRRLMGAALIAGIIFVTSQLIVLFMPDSSVQIRIIEKSLQYNPSFIFPPVLFYILQGFYVFAAISPFFFSSLRRMWVYALLNSATFLTAYLIYNQTFSSVWCFYAAIVSAMLYFVMRSNGRLYKNEA